MTMLEIEMIRSPGLTPSGIRIRLSTVFLSILSTGQGRVSTFADPVLLERPSATFRDGRQYEILSLSVLMFPAGHELPLVDSSVKCSIWVILSSSRKFCLCGNLRRFPCDHQFITYATRPSTPRRFVGKSARPVLAHRCIVVNTSP